jgi:RNA polymerase sigma-70 factor (ECF subfamily)
VIASLRKDEQTPDQRARLRELYEEFAPFVSRSLRRLGASEADLDDLLQEVFLVVYRRLADYEERDRARAWLYSICVRVTQGQRRRLFRRRENLTAKLLDGLAPASQLQSVEDREALLWGRRLLAQLPLDQSEVFVLYEVEDMTMSQIAESVGCPLQTAYSRLYKARARIVAELERTRTEGADP